MEEKGFELALECYRTANCVVDVVDDIGKIFERLTEAAAVAR